MADYGQIFSISDIKRQLLEANKTYEGKKTWEQLYGSVSLAEQQMQSELSYDYAKEIGEAYKSAMLNESDIMASNLGQGFKQRELEENELALQEAFNAYQQNYLENMQTLSTNINKQQAGITSALTEQAEYIKQFAETPYQYLTHLYEEYSDSGLFEEDLWKRYLNEEGELKSWEELINPTYEEYTDEEGNIHKDWTSLYDDKGNLTIRGADFYDQMMNQLAYEGNIRDVDGTQYELPTFGKWLSEENEELYNWSQSYNPYDYNEGITNLGSFKTLVGLTSTDQEYQFLERYSGMTKKELEGKFEKYKNFKLTGGTNLSDIETVENLMTDVKTFAKTLGIDKDLEKDLGGWDNLEKILNNSKTSLIDVERMRSDASNYYNSNIILNALQSVGGFLENAGKFVYNLFSKNDLEYRDETDVTKEYNRRMEEADKAEEKNKALVKETEEAYLDLVTSLTAYAEQKRRQKQIEFNNNNK